MRKCSLFLPLFLLACTFDTSGLRAQGSICSNGILETGEECDLVVPAGISCESLGYDSGELACRADCRLDRSGCTGGQAICGNNLIEGDEVCDGTDLGGRTCVGLGYTGGQLACTSQCSLDVTGCINENPVCGDGIIDTDEECDGTNIGGASCTSLGYHGGTPLCTESCTLDLTPCIATGRCGDSLIQDEHGEECDGTNLDGASCTELGYYGGTPLCTGTCTLDIAPCIAAGRCGDNLIQDEHGEECDGTNIGAASCTALGYHGGTPLCSGTCALDIAPCIAAGRCGDGLVQTTYGEQCDGTNLNSRFCREFGFFGGALACDTSCELNNGTCRNTSQFGTAQEDSGNVIAIDANSNIFVAGRTLGVMGTQSFGDSDMFIVKFDRHGNPLGILQLGSPQFDSPRAISIDSAGNVYIAGVTYGSFAGGTHLGSGDIFIVKLSNNLNVLWTRQWGTDQLDGPRQILSDGSGIYVTGTTYGVVPAGGAYSIPNYNFGEGDFFIAHWNHSGNFQWGRQYGTDQTDVSFAMTFSGTTHLVAAGYTNGAATGFTNQGFSDVLLIKVQKSDGTLVSYHQFGTTGYDGANDIKADASGNLYVTGYTSGSLSGMAAGNLDMFVRRMNANYVTSWTRQWGTTGEDDASALVLNSTTGFGYLAGYASGPLNEGTHRGYRDIILLRFSLANGADSWTRQLGSGGDDLAYGVARDPTGTICLTGIVGGPVDGQSHMGSFDALVHCTNP